MVIVSHDRHMLKMVTDKLLLVEGGKAQEFDGDLDDYSVWLQKRFREEEQAAGQGEIPVWRPLTARQDVKTSAVNRPKSANASSHLSKKPTSWKKSWKNWRSAKPT